MKKNTKASSRKTKKEISVKKKIDTKKRKTKAKKKVGKGFTLIELLAVIIILGVLMIIAIPAVTEYINNSRKSGYIDSAKNIISGTRNFVNQGTLGMFDTGVTYYIPTKCIATENSSRSPYGEFTEAYVGVTYTGIGYNYYWISVDSTGQGIKELTPYNGLKEYLIESNISQIDIRDEVSSTGVGNRISILILSDDCKSWNDPLVATNFIDDDGNTGAEVPDGSKICRRAGEGTLHTVNCTATNGTYYCSGAGYTNSGRMHTTTITYGTLGTEGETPVAGDAFDCDVNGDGVYDSTTERFYYLGSNGNESTLIYYTSVAGGTTPTQNNYAYYGAASENWHGPKTAYEQLPSKSQWKNRQLISPGIRNIKNEVGGNTTNNGSYDIEQFQYKNKAARLVTYQEVVAACGSGNVRTRGYLDKCNYLMENVKQYETGNTGAFGYWTETPTSAFGIAIWYVSCDDRMLDFSFVSCAGCDGVRPVITVSISNIKY